MKNTIEQLEITHPKFSAFICHLATVELWDAIEIARVVDRPHRYTNEFNNWISNE